MFENSDIIKVMHRPSKSTVNATSPTLKNWVLVGCLFLLTFATAAKTWAQASTEAGKVVFVTGVAMLHQPQGTPRPIQHGQGVQQGERLQTGADGHIYIRMADNALLVLRPGSTLAIDHWQYNPDKPEQSQIKYTLQQGTSRYVSGRGSQAAKERFRFNTPMAAIGVRGTDFTVLAREDLTQVAVRSGGVVVSPFDVSCTREAIGPCEGRLATEFFAQGNAHFLQIRSGDQRPQIIKPNGTRGPDQTPPPLGTEPNAKNNQPSATEVVALAVANELRNERLTTLLAAQKMPEYAPPALATWGRWSQLSADEASVFMRQLLQDRQLVGISTDYVLARNTNVNMQLPESGVGSFKLREHEGVYRSNTAASPQNTFATGGQLQIDFGQRSYQTEIQLDLNGQALRFQSAGNLESGNLLESSVLSPATTLKGTVGGNNAGQAAYLYRHKLPTGAELSGATVWGR